MDATQAAIDSERIIIQQQEAEDKWLREQETSE